MQHIPDKGEHLVRYYGWYSHRRRGRRAQQAARREIQIDRSLARGEGWGESTAGNSRCSTWAAWIQRVYEVDPLTCPRYGSPMRVISFIESRQREVIEKFLRHCGLWEGPLRTLAQVRTPAKIAPHPDTDEPPELQLVVDPEYL